MGLLAYRRLQFKERKAGQLARVRTIARLPEIREPADVYRIVAEEYVKARREMLGKEN